MADAQLLQYSALARLELANVWPLGQTYAIFVVLIAIPFYGETVGICRFITVIFGFSAVLLIMQPGTFFCLELLVANWCRLLLRHINRLLA